MIKAIILDVDGVIVGEKIGFNSPYPNSKIIERLKSIKQKGISISLCTAKPHYSIQKIINDAGLNNLHITNGGGVIIDPIQNTILKKHIIDQKYAVKVIETYLKNNVYVEFYTLSDYFIQKNQQSNLTQIHTHILQKEPQVVNLLMDEIKKQEIVKIMPITRNEEDKKNLTLLFNPYKNDLTLSWGVHPIALPHQFGIITAKGISKRQAVLEIANSIKVQLQVTGNLLKLVDMLAQWVMQVLN